jgi:hypothetical protein
MRVTSPVSPTVSRPTPPTTKPAPEKKPALEGKPVLEGRPIVDPSLIKLGDKFERKQGAQLNEIADGVRNGSITADESKKLLEEQKAIAQAQREAEADGKVTKSEELKLKLMQMRAERNIDSAAGNKDRDVFARFDKDAQRQADQIERLGNGRTTGNITDWEASRLLGQQAEIAGARDGATGPLGDFMLDRKLDQAEKDIKHHSRSGTQLPTDIFPGPKPLPLPLPKPFPLPEIELPKPGKPGDFHALPVLING